ncbi:MAG: deoxynucleoside kinase [Ignavibacteriae bacterium]|nr:deoxynucleoside kinase [Ignavibacteriota bacterium]
MKSAARRKRARSKRKSRRKHFIAIAGNIGSGKSSLTRLLGERFNWKPYFESVEDNPYLSDFYADMRRWSFNLQVYFLSNRFRSHKAITEGPTSVVLDRVIYEDAEIFAHNLYEIGNMEERDYRNYVALYEVMTEYLRPPDLLIYLRANVDTLLRQIALRGRDFEQSIQREYLEQLNKHYEAWTSRYKLGPLLTVESDSLDFVNKKGDLDRVVKMIRGML